MPYPRNYNSFESKDQYYWRKSKERYSRAEWPIAMMAMVALQGPDEITAEEAIRQACEVFKLIRESDGAILKANGLDLQFFGAPPIRIEGEDRMR